MVSIAAAKRRRPLRLADYDYAQAGAYYITVCTHQRVCLFGHVVGGEMKLNPAGQMVWRWWRELERKFPDVMTDECVVMPNHIHGILVVGVGADLCVGPESKHEEGAHAGAPLPKIAQWFKTMTTNDSLRGVKQGSWPALKRQLWQRNYYEQVIRGEDSLNRIRQYIVDNPARWEFDRENPHAVKTERIDIWRVDDAG